LGSPEKAVNLHPILQRKVVNILQNIPAVAIYEECQSADGPLCTSPAGGSPPVLRQSQTKMNAKLLHEFAAAINQLAYWALVRLPKDFTQETTCVFTDGMKD
jgi:hypothetical protein